ncbi:hypothetical protein GCM10022244_41410 [Streptomyces gulbargensis]|uniref:Secreted protein n=2 Tax=Streptomyces gulbargensis TaxID=364901 RepID=A0ABP7MQ94_9ACTN
MNLRYARGRWPALLCVSTLALVGCGADGVPQNDKKPTVSASPAPSDAATQVPPQDEEPAATLALVKGQKGLELSVHAADRDQGGFITIKGRLKNTSQVATVLPAQMSGDETEVVKHGNSLGGATLIDSVGKKRYYVLRDTDGRPLTTSGLDSLGPGKSTSVFMQFPAPPATTTEVSLQLPTFEPATLKLS